MVNVMLKSIFWLRINHEIEFDTCGTLPQTLSQTTSFAWQEGTSEITPRYSPLRPHRFPPTTAGLSGVQFQAPPRSLTDMATAGGAAPPVMDEKARRTRDLLASFYNTDPSVSAAAPASPASLARLSPTATAASPLDSINSTSFDPENYMNVLVSVFV